MYVEVKLNDDYDDVFGVLGGFSVFSDNEIFLKIRGLLWIVISM